MLAPVTTPTDPAETPAVKPSSSRIVRYFRERHDPLTSLVLTVPVFLVYHLGILLIDIKNGVDLVSTLTFAVLHASVGAYIGMTLTVAGGLLGAGLYLRKKGKLQPHALPPVLLESIVLALLMALLVGWATGHIFAQQVGAKPLSIIDKIVMSAGAGFHEELVFRVCIFAGGAWALMKSDMKPVLAFSIAAVVSAFMFSAVHYVGMMSDEFSLVSFTFRVLAGLYLAAVYKLRGFAVAVYTHALYDMFVFFIF